ncbi:hypothetical protein KO516_21860 [Citreicella sp. C3M06]|uniref:hypothetical protein n=1 Tax=Roseobacteraceae TaxID=2854170 RepID=UPI001C08DD31|nr:MULTISPECIES: hypothetical protein [Roseobacteraceae]MBU2963422.1 hypothetical protein [Citreicella sp. C3M06]MDO6585749.1 hypothetical protein [Salipiger sp. 1_MG-2023]
MSAPDTDVPTQKKRHRPPLLGMWAGLGLVAILFLGWLFMTVGAGTEDGAESETPVTQMDGASGQVEQVSPADAATSDDVTINSPAADAD